MRLHDIIIWFAAALAVWAPGAAIRTLSRTRSGSDLTSAIALDCAAGLAFWPLAYLFVSCTPWALHATGITFIVYGAIILLVARFQPRGVAALWEAITTRRAPRVP